MCSYFFNNTDMLVVLDNALLDTFGAISEYLLFNIYTVVLCVLSYKTMCVYYVRT